MLRTQLGINAPPGLATRAAECPPYAELSRPLAKSATQQRPTPIFITGRFRSGSTLFWNLFRNLADTTSYYEPFNERRWFDPSIRGSHVDPTHLNVENYWMEYDGLESLGKYYREEWIDKQLYMSAQSWDPAMQMYIDMLIRSAKGRAVLQFNRVDLRLPWLRAKFPRAKILHVFRHPRDQWYSTLRGFNGDMRTLNLESVQPFDGFYLLSWARDLRHYFPFIELSPETHPYEVFYQIWKLSFVFGRGYADVSVAFEDVLAAPKERIANVMHELGIERYDIDRLAALVSPMATGKWKKWQSGSLFDEIEARVDKAVSEFFVS